MTEVTKARYNWKSDSLARKCMNSFNGLKAAFFMETAIARESACAFPFFLVFRC